MDLYLKQLSTRYKQASKKEKGKILDEYCATSQHSRKHAIKSINNAFRAMTEHPAKKSRAKPTGRPKTYNNPELIEAVKNIWLATDQMCGKRLKPALAGWLPHYEKHYGRLSDETLRLLNTISSASLDRLLKPFRAHQGKGYSGTKPGSLLKTQIPILTDQWNESSPGFVEADTVAHCGDSLAGDFIWSLTLTDIFSGWTEIRALWGKGSSAVVEAIADIEASIPFQLKGFDSDNGSEFLNYHLLRYFAHPEEKEKLRVQFTRSRPYKKNDNAHVEQKNWTHVRQLLGYHRLDDNGLSPLINTLYKRDFCLLTNYFYPCVKLIEKSREGSKIKKKHSLPITPFQRLMQSSEISSKQKEQLQNTYDSLDPFALKKSIEKQLKIIFSKVKTQVTKPRVAI